MRMHLVLQVQIPNDTRPTPKPQFYDADLYARSAASAEAYAKTTGAVYMLVTDDRFRPGFQATYQSLGMLTLPGYDRILYLDSDVIVQPGCPNIFDTETLGLSAVPNFDPTWPNHVLWEGRKRRRVGVWTRPTFNGGVWLTTREWRERIAPIVAQNFDRWFYRKRFNDEEMLNAALGENPYTELSPDWGAWYRYGKFMDHISTHRRNELAPAASAQ